MTIEPGDLLLFARIVDAGSFSAAAQRAALPKSTVSRRLAALEDALGERLLLRTTRKLVVTDFGHDVLGHARQLAAEVEAAEALALQRQAGPAGRLRVSMPADLAETLAALLAAFAAAHPAVSLELDLSPRRVDLIGENFDLALRMGELPDDASVAARRLAVFPVGVYAAPAYLARRGEPAHPQELPRHDALRLLGRDGEPLRWSLRRGDEHWHGVPPGRATANSPGLLLRLACAGLGVAVIADRFAAPLVAGGALRRLFADWRIEPETAWAVFPGRRLMPSRTRAFLDALQAEFA